MPKKDYALLSHSPFFFAALSSHHKRRHSADRRGRFCADHATSYLQASEHSVRVYAVLRAAAVHHGAVGVAVVARGVAAMRRKEKKKEERKEDGG